jgi:hypothetical protein
VADRNHHITVEGPFGGVRIARGDGWTVSVRGHNDLSCVYSEGTDRQLSFAGYSAGSADLGGCEWRWKGEIGEKERIGLAHREVIIERMSAAIKALMGARRIETYRLKVKAGLVPSQPDEPAPDSIHVIRIGDYLRFSYGVRTLTVPLDFRRAEHEAAIAVRRADFER